MLAGGWALGAGACAVVDTLLAAMLVEGMAANGWALDAGPGVNTPTRTWRRAMYNAVAKAKARKARARRRSKASHSQPLAARASTSQPLAANPAGKVSSFCR